MAKILYVDDCSDHRELLRIWFADAPYETAIVEDAQEALEGLLNGDYAFGIVDQNMPKMTGLELITKVREGGNAVPILLVSENLDEKTHKAAQEAGALGLAEKMCHYPTFISAIREFLEGNSAGFAPYLTEKGYNFA